MKTVEMQKTRAASHGCLFFASLVIVNVLFPSLPWPWYLVIPVLVYGGIVLVIGPLRRTAPTLAIGRVGGWPLLAAAGLAVTTTGVLVGFNAVFQPDVADLAAKLPAAWFGSLLLAGAVFSVVNAAVEELIFRGILWDVVSEEWGQAAALSLTAVLFGIVQLHGYPPGPIGAFLASLYSVTLGAVRWWTGGLGLATACHVGADATIFCMVAGTGAFDGD